MKFNPRPGIVYTKICGIGILVPTRSIFDVCEEIEILPFLQDAAWRSLSEGNSVENLIKAYQILTKCTEEEAVEYFTSFINHLREKGFLLPDDEKTEE